MDRSSADRLVTATAGRIARAWIATIQHIRDTNSVADIAARLHTGDPVRGLPEAFTGFAAAEHNAYAHAGQAAARWLGGELTPIKKKLLTFDPADPSVMSWAERNRLDRVSGLTFEQRSLVRAALIGQEDSAANPLVVAREIRDAIGLTPAQEAAVQSYRRALEHGQYAAALERELSSGVSDRAIAAAMRRDAQLTPAQIETAVERYRANYITLRAETIARTEGSRIANQGMDEMYRQATARGDLPADALEQTWYHSPTANNEHERKFHRSMHGQVVPWGQPFISGLGNPLRFPCDPDAPAKETVNCRCARAVRVRAMAMPKAA